MRGPVGLDGREYKLLLDAGNFPGAPSGKTARNLWSKHLKPIIDTHLDAKDSGSASRASGALRANPEKQRSVAFLDTGDGVLAGGNFALRLRTRFLDGEPVGLPEVTLKFRTPDFLLAAEYFRIARAQAGETTLEEDIAPLQVARKGKQVAVAKPRSVYSRFSVSTKIKDFSGSFDSLGDVLNQFTALKNSLDAKASRRSKLVPGATICEWVYDNAAVDLGEDLNAKFAFTLWFLSRQNTRQDPWRQALSGKVGPRVAEISFDFDTKQGRMDRAAAKRASRLFLAMQSKLQVDRTIASKTALGLPSGA